MKKYPVFIFVIIFCLAVAGISAQAPVATPTPQRSGALADLLNSASMMDFNVQRSLAEIAIEQGKYDEAIKTLDKEITRAADDYISLADRGLAYYFKDDLVNALADAQRSLTIRNEWPMALTVRALVERSRSQTVLADKDFDLAVRRVTEAIGQHPDHSDRYNSRAEIYRLKGDREKAIADYRKVLELVPDQKYTQKRLDAYLAEGSSVKPDSDPRYTKAVTDIDNLLLQFDREFAKLKADIQAQKIHSLKVDEFEANCNSLNAMHRYLSRVKAIIARMEKDQLPVYEAGAAQQKAKNNEWYKLFSEYKCFV